MEIRQIRADEGLRLRDIRIRSLRDSPGAFGSTLQEALLRTDEYWERRAVRNAAGEDSIIFVAEDGPSWRGIAGGVIEAEEQPGQVELISMWVDSTGRRRGTAGLLVEAVMDWARGRGARAMSLWVTDDNYPAIGLYEALGFESTGERQPLPSQPSLDERRMIRDL